MARRSDSGNFVMLLLGAAIASVWLGNWAFKAVLWIGVIIFALGVVAHIIDSWGLGSASPSSKPSKARSAPAPVVRSTLNRLPRLLSAVASKDSHAIEQLVLRDSVSPFQKTRWRDRDVSAIALAEETGYEEAVRFFKDWSKKGATARFRRS